MRAIERSSAFKRDYKRAKATPRHGKDLDSLVSTVLALLLRDEVLPANYRDHRLIGAWAGC
jgi:mRNA interferase YafQ